MRHDIEAFPDLIDAFNRSDWMMFRSYLSPEVVYKESGTGRHAEGSDAYVALLQTWHDALPDVYGTVTDTVIDGDRLAQRVTWTGTHRPTGVAGDHDSSDRTTRPSGVHPVDTLGDRKIVRLFHHMDVMGMLQQLGLLNDLNPSSSGLCPDSPGQRLRSGVVA
ncbi:ester cyclase [Deinococcus oregonensis]|uniref:Ester cyclase n=1 Tax=Deinococcus oregonensis TaxID=1805970 RepID=A0ABV6AW19_9DEIO